MPPTSHCENKRKEKCWTYSTERLGSAQSRTNPRPEFPQCRIFPGKVDGKSIMEIEPVVRQFRHPKISQTIISSITSRIRAWSSVTRTFLSLECVRTNGNPPKYQINHETGSAIEQFPQETPQTTSPRARRIRDKEASLCQNLGAKQGIFVTERSKKRLSNRSFRNATTHASKKLIENASMLLGDHRPSFLLIRGARSI